MARRIRDRRLETRSARLRLAASREPYWVKIADRAYLGYRRINGENGSWWLRCLLERTTRYEKQAFAKADDYAEADGLQVLDYFGALDAAKKRASVAGGPATVADAARQYLAWLTAQGKNSVVDTRTRINAFVLPHLGATRLRDLTAANLERWLHNLARQPPRRRTKAGDPQAFGREPKTAEELRKRRNSANRTWNVLHALLEFAHTKGLVAHTEWRKVKRLERAETPRIRHLDESQARRLAHEATALDPSFGRLVSAALLTGCRFGELAALTAADYSDGRIYVRPGKTERARYVTLSNEGAELFGALAAGTAPNEVLLTKTQGGPWNKNDYQRLLRRASAAAHITPPVEFHTLRHTFASILLAHGVPIEVISRQLGHSNIHVTLRHYAHLADQQVREIMNNKMPKIGVTARQRVVGIR